MTPKTKPQRRKIGDLVRIELGDGFHTYAHVLEESMFAFYDCRSIEDLLPNQIVSSPILFQVPVMKYAITKGHWKIIANSPLSDALRNPPPRFVQDALRPEIFEIYEKGTIRPATKEECRGLERAAGWSPQHVEDRLKDHYAGRPNKWVESLKIREPRKLTTGCDCSHG